MSRLRPSLGAIKKNGNGEKNAKSKSASRHCRAFLIARSLLLFVFVCACWVTSARIIVKPPDVITAPFHIHEHHKNLAFFAATGKEIEGFMTVKLSS